MQLRRSTRTTAATSNGLSSLSPLSLPRRETSAIPHIDNVTSKQESSDAGGGLADRVKLRSRKSSLAAIKLEMPENHSETSTSPILTPPQTPFSEVHTRKHVEIAFEEQLGSPSGSSSSPRKKTRTTASTTASTTDKSLRPVAKAPEGWETTYNLIKQYRDMVIAPVDTMGCERLAEVGEGIDPKMTRFQTLVSLMLSSQTKDQVTAGAIHQLRTRLPGGLTLKSILECDAGLLQNCICKVGFHSKKSIYIKEAARICRDQYDGDIPDTIEGLMSLPGVGPKMGYLALQCAWNINAGIGVDVHVHRITNRLGWCNTEKEGPEATRKALEAWLPPPLWQGVNPLLVGFGQTTCLSRGPRCGICPVQERCPTGRKELRKVKVKKEVKVEGEIVLKDELKVEEEHGILVSEEIEVKKEW